ncbi:hypothetical protein ACSDT2_001729 [Escherichia coli]|uniref:Uncharacterized protein n=1 Tax=Proteus mirabilis TaxID=584 RepID=A0A5P2YBV7_PROMI|nr:MULTISPECIES: hypothetical protein [Enterobacterales]EHQ8952890.1 hypothetical protein [Escherichia coli]EIA0766399.1 hypothetical protein [Escherichia coli]ELM5145053.1 hypothetical protein [Escherichia coli]EMD7149682.1 hypothetical protein [Escherichia coli]MBB2363108.1 hypothetical protein [Escherichia coli]
MAKAKSSFSEVQIARRIKEGRGPGTPIDSAKATTHFLIFIDDALLLYA